MPIKLKLKVSVKSLVMAELDDAVSEFTAEYTALPTADHIRSELTTEYSKMIHNRTDPEKILLVIDGGYRICLKIDCFFSVLFKFDSDRLDNTTRIYSYIYIFISSDFKNSIFEPKSVFYMP